MTSKRILPGFDKNDPRTYPTVWAGAIREMTGAQRLRLVQEIQDADLWNWEMRKQGKMK